MYYTSYNNVQHSMCEYVFQNANKTILLRSSNQAKTHQILF